MSTFQKTGIGFLLAALFISAALLNSYRSTDALIEASHAMAYDMEFILELERVSTLLVTAQNNLRAHYVTGQSHYRELYETARRDFSQSLDKAAALAAETPVRAKQMASLRALTDDKLAAWDQSAETYRRGGAEAIVGQLRASQVKEQDLIISEKLNAIKREARRVSTDRNRAGEEQGRTTKTLLLIGGLLALFLIALAGWIVYRDNRAREQAEHQMDRFFNISLDLLCISGMDGYFKRLSPSFAQVLGFSVKELCSKPISEFVHPDDIARTNAEIEKQSRGSKVLAFENRFRHLDGTYRIFSWKSVPVGDLMYAVARDVTDQKKFETALMEAREAAHNAALTKAAFLANMSHEIRTPLNGVVGMTDLLGRTKLSAEQQTFLTAIKTSTQILLKIVNEILDFSKIEAGRVEVESLDFDLSQLIESRTSLCGIAAHEKNLRLEASVDPKIPRVLRGDAGKIGQILMNLVSNAIKFTEAGRVTVSAEIRAQDSSQCWVKFTVRDSGVGISGASASRLFEPFVQADESTARKFGGTGLGLSICKRYVEMMNGEIGVESQIGQGSIFWFNLPLEISPANFVATVKPSAIRPKVLSDPRQSEKRRSFRILVAEDNHINQLIVMNMMGALGYSASVARNGLEAVEQFTLNRPHLILMDQHMPLMDGIEASAEIRRLETESGAGRIPIIAFTATVIQDSERPQFKKLMDDFLLKPVTMDALETVLSEWERRISDDVV